MHVVVTHHRIIHHQLSSHWTHRPVVVAMIVKKLSAIAINMPSTSEWTQGLNSNNSRLPKHLSRIRKEGLRLSRRCSHEGGVHTIPKGRESHMDLSINDVPRGLYKTKAQTCKGVCFTHGAKEMRKRCSFWGLSQWNSERRSLCHTWSKDEDETVQPWGICTNIGRVEAVQDTT